MDENIALAVRAELGHLVGSDWKVIQEADVIRLIAPKSTASLTDRVEQLQSEAWRIAQFVGYSSFVSISKTPDYGFSIVSRMTSGDGFEIRLEHG